ncbi:MAG TPA: hypothetical protein VLW88_05480 [Hyphomicrobium sp.]|jgi:hypothetical protein|nr:hypothetical protein [Hyphomicrobium sp.]
MGTHLSDSPLKRLRPAPGSVYLLAEHLDAALAAGEDLTGVLFVWSGAPPREDAELIEFRAQRREAIERIRTFELMLIARLLKGREWAVTVATEDERFQPVARLYVAGTGTLLDAVAECADLSSEDFETGDDLTAYVRSRGLIAADAAGLCDTAPLAANEAFLVAKRAPLGVLLDLVASFLDALEAEFDLFPALENENGRGLRPPASLTI